MDREQQVRFVIKEMRRYRKVNDIIFDLCEKTGGQWNETAAFVHQVIRENAGQIERARQPLIIAIAGVLTLGGLGGVVASLVLTLDGVIIFINFIPYAGNILIFVASLGALAGGLRGLYDLFMKPQPET